MARVSLEWQIEVLSDYDLRGRRLCRITETDHRDADDQIFVLPCIVSEAFVRARRQFKARTMRDEGAFRVEDHFDLPPEMLE